MGRFNKLEKLKVVSSAISKRDSTRGVAIVELAMIAPIILIFCIGILDVGSLLFYHARLTQMTREGVRLAAGAPALETGRCLFDEAAVPQCQCSRQGAASVACGSGAFPNQEALLTRIRNFVIGWQNRESMSFVPNSRRFAVAFQERFDPADPSLKTLDPDEVGVEIGARYQAFFPLWQNKMILVRHTAPHL